MWKLVHNLHFYLHMSKKCSTFAGVMRYSRYSLNKAGQALLDPFTRGEVIEQVSDWRMTHLPVLREFVEEMTKYLNDNDVPFAFYSQRVKRMTSIIEKLRNNPTMGLGGLQDIGGARFVFDSIQELERCKQALENFTPANFTFVRTTDYIAVPKESGYRSIHYIYQYHSDNKDYDGLKIELQIRTRLEHSWAMAVETASLISRTSLKANIEDGSVWRDFFRLVSAIFAQREQCRVADEFANYTHEDYCRKYVDCLNKHKLIDQLSALRVTVNSDDIYADAPNGYCLLSINFNEKTVQCKTYASEDESEASATFAKLEQNIDSNEAVLFVSVAKMQEIYEAYPSYFLDTRTFLSELSAFNASCAIYFK